MVFGPENALRALIELAALDKWDYGRALRRILRVDSEVLDVERVNLWLLRSEPRLIFCEEGFVSSSDEYERGRVLLGEEYPRYFAAMREEKAIVAHDAHRDPRTKELSATYLTPLGIGAMMDVPVWSRGRLEGVLCHEHVGGPRQWEKSELTIAMAMGQAVANTLEVLQRRQAEEALRRTEEARILLAAREQTARERIRARDQFLSIASHELYTPLTSLQLAIQSLKATLPGDAATQKRLALVKRQVQRLNQLVSSLLDVTRLEVGRFEIAGEELDLAALGADVATRFGELAARSGCELRLHTPATVVGWWDRSRLDQVITNLLSNAIKFSSGTPIDLTVEKDGGEARITVRDRGIGIPPDKLPHIFDRFQSAVSTRSYGGLGLGLFITRAIVEAHAGTVQIDSEEGRGTTVIVELPIRERDGETSETDDSDESADPAPEP